MKFRCTLQSQQYPKRTILSCGGGKMRGVFQHSQSWQDVFCAFLQHSPHPNESSLQRGISVLRREQPLPETMLRCWLSWVWINSNWHTTSHSWNLKYTLQYHIMLWLFVCGKCTFILFFSVLKDIFLSEVLLSLLLVNTYLKQPQA